MGILSGFILLFFILFFISVFAFWIGAIVKGSVYFKKPLKKTLFNYYTGYHLFFEFGRMLHNEWHLINEKFNKEIE